MNRGDLVAGLVVAAFGLGLLLAAPALARLHARLLEWQLDWVRGAGGRWLWRLVGAVLLAAGAATLWFAGMR